MSISEEIKALNLQEACKEAERLKKKYNKDLSSIAAKYGLSDIFLKRIINIK